MNLSRERLFGFPLRLPELADQRAIARVLGTLDDKVELNRRMSETLEAMAWTLFKSWFVDFDPVRAKAEGRETGLPREIAGLFPDRLVESEIGEVPEGWAVTPIGTSVTLSRAALDPGDYPDEVFSHYSIPAYNAGKAPARDRGNTIKSQKLLVIEGCVLISKLNPSIPRIWLPGAWAGMRQVASTEFLVCSGETGSGYSKELIYCLVSSAPILEYLTGLASGTSNSHQRVSPDDFMAYRWAEPPEPTREAFSRHVAPILTRTERLRKESATLSALRDALLPRLISGQLRASGD